MSAFISFYGTLRCTLAFTEAGTHIHSIHQHTGFAADAEFTGFVIGFAMLTEKNF